MNLFKVIMAFHVFLLANAELHYGLSDIVKQIRDKYIIYGAGTT